MLAISGERSTGEDVRVQNVTAVAAVANIVKVRKCTYNTSMQKTNTNNKKCVYIYIQETVRVCMDVEVGMYVFAFVACADRGRYASMLLLFMIGRMNEMK